MYFSLARGAATVKSATLLKSHTTVQERVLTLYSGKYNNMFETRLKCTQRRTLWLLLAISEVARENKQPQAGAYLSLIHI